MVRLGMIGLLLIGVIILSGPKTSAQVGGGGKAPPCDYVLTKNSVTFTWDGGQMKGTGTFTLDKGGSVQIALIATAIDANGSTEFSEPVVVAVTYADGTPSGTFTLMGNPPAGERWVVQLDFTRVCDDADLGSSQDYGMTR